MCVWKKLSRFRCVEHEAGIQAYSSRKVGSRMDVRTTEVQKKLQELVKAAKEKKNVLEYGEVQAALNDLHLTETQYDKVMEYLGCQRHCVLVSQIPMMRCFHRMTRNSRRMNPGSGKRGLKRSGRDDNG